MARRLLTALVAATAVSGCNWYYNTVPSPDDLLKLVPWFDHMITSPVPSPYKRADVPRYTPPGAVPITGGEAEWGVGNPAGFPPVYGFDTVTANALVNPTVDRAATLARGDSLYSIFCTVCHGAIGDGRGPVGVRLGAASLLTDRAKGYRDGYLYSLVRYGRGVMPPYGDKIFRPADRWAVVNYLRELQGLGGTSSPASASNPGAPR
jgi:mono/diheme cytochrome c family protein